MQYAIRTGDPARLATPLLAIVLPQDGPLPKALTRLDQRFGGALARALQQQDFRGKRDEALLLVNPGRSGPARLLLVGVGPIGDSYDAANALRRAAAVAGRKANTMGVQRMAIWSPILEGELVEAAIVGVGLGAWMYDALKTMPPRRERPKPLVSCEVCVTAVAGSAEALVAGTAIAEAQALGRRLQFLPGNICTPEYLARTAREIAARNKQKVSVFGRRDLKRMKMGSFLAVAQGTPQDPKLIVLEHRGGPRGQKPVVLVGKGLCFDSGGISIKPAERMEWMKYDMSGAAGVLAAMDAIGRMKLPINVVGLVGSTTNMPSGTAMNPGDVVIASNSKSIEIVNTDAEGRLVLADVLVYAKRFDPEVVVDAATLTGAVVIGLGSVAVGVMGNDQSVIDEMLAVQRRAGEPGWQLPLWDEYKEQIRTDVADMKNTGGRGAGTITAGLFLQEFVDGYPWVHLDVAGTAYSEVDLGHIPRGPTGTPMRTFVEFVRGRVR